MNNIHFNGEFVHLHSNINEEGLQMLLHPPKVPVQRIGFVFAALGRDNFQETEQDLTLLNRYFELHPEVWMEWTQPEWLDRMPNLQKLSIGKDFAQNHLGALTKLKKVTALSVLDATYVYLKEVPFKESMEELKLSRGGHEKGVAFFAKELAGFRNLKFFFTDFDLPGFDSLREMPLETLYYGWGKVKDYSALEHLTGLKNIRIRSNRTLKDFSFLQKLPLLETIDLNETLGLTVMPPISHLQHLQQVSVVAKNLESLEPFRNLPPTVKVYVHTRTFSYNSRVDYGKPMEELLFKQRMKK